MTTTPLVYRKPGGAELIVAAGGKLTLESIPFSLNQVMQNVASLVTLKAQGFRFLQVPDTYYELLPQRLPDTGENTRLAGGRRAIFTLHDADYCLPEGESVRRFHTRVVGVWNM